MKKFKPTSRIIYFAARIFAFVLITLLVSCKSDTTTGPPVNPPQTNDSLIFQKDSLVLRSTDLDSLKFYVALYSLDSFKIEFTGLSNIDSSKGNFWFTIWVSNDSNVNITSYFVYGTQSITEFNSFHSNQFRNFINPGIVVLYLKIYNSLTNEPKYIILKNVKIYKIKT